MILPIIKYPAKALVTKASSVEIFDTPFDNTLELFVKDMHETMKAGKGIGLAANQVNVLKRILVIHIPESSPHTFINPEIISKEGKFKFKEGCLSFPEIFEDIERSQKIKVKAQDVNGNYFEVEAEDLFAVCLQHEIDHLDGIVFTKHMSRLKASIINRKIAKRDRPRH